VPGQAYKARKKARNTLIQGRGTQYGLKGRKTKKKASLRKELPGGQKKRNWEGGGGPWYKEPTEKKGGAEEGEGAGKTVIRKGVENKRKTKLDTPQ